LLFGGLGPGTAFAGQELQLIGRVNRAIWLAAGLGATLGLVLAVVLSRSLTAPLRSLTASMNRFARGERNFSLPAASRDEVGDLTVSFRRLVGEIERQEGLRKEMTADIAHELRNPIAVIQANVESLVDGVYPATAENLAPVLESVHLLSRLVEDLRTLALADAGRLAMELGATDVAPVLRRVANAFEVRLRQAGPIGRRRHELGHGDGRPAAARTNPLQPGQQCHPSHARRRPGHHASLIARRRARAHRGHRYRQRHPARGAGARF
jgi:signal transduction histidine kinase